MLTIRPTRACSPKMDKELTGLHSRKTSNPIEKGARDLNRHISKDYKQRAQRHRKRYSASLAIRVMPIQTTWTYHLTPVRVAKVSNPHTKGKRIQRKGNPSALLVGMQTAEATVENTMEFLQKTKHGTAL